MGKTLRKTVYLTGSDGSRQRLDPGTPFTRELGKKITNPSAWQDDEPVAEAQSEPNENPPDENPAGGDQGGTDEGGQDTGGGDGGEGGDSAPQTGDDSPVEPPRSGKGSGEEAWKEFARALDVTVPDGASRDDIVAFLIERGLIEAEPTQES